jgi:hypothetical protein
MVAGKRGTEMSIPTKTKVNVLVADDYEDRFPEVVEAARRAGLDVVEQLPTIGLISGEIDAAKRPMLDGVPGIASIEESRDFQLPPPDSEVQ